MTKGSILIVALAAFLILTSTVQAQTTTTDSVAFALSDRTADTFATVGGTGDVATGYARVQPAGGSTAPSGFAIFGLRTNNVLVTEAAVPVVRTIFSGRTYAEVDGPTNTGIAIANPNTVQLTVAFSIYGEIGNVIRQGTFTLAPGTQISRFLDQDPFSASGPFSGTLQLDAPLPFSVTALRGFTNERGEFLITTQNVASGPTSTSPAIIGQFAEGGGWRTRVLLVNPTDATITGNVQFFGQGSGATAGAPIGVTIEGSIATTFNYSIPARGARVLVTAGLGATTQLGSIRITPSNATAVPSAFAVYSFTSQGVMVSEFAVSAEPTTTAARMYVESRRNVIQSGFAIANTSSTTATVNLELLNENGTSTGQTATITIPASGQTSRFLNQVFSNAPAPLDSVFRGILRITSGTTPIAIVGVRGRYNERGDFLATTTPVSNEAGASSSAEVLFPHLADRGGYTTQFVLFSGISGQTSNGVVRFFDQSGQAMNLTIE